MSIASLKINVSALQLGKGIHFVDVVGQDAQYCFTDQNYAVVLMLLCEVALGEVHKTCHSEHIRSPILMLRYIISHRIIHSNNILCKFLYLT